MPDGVISVCVVVVGGGGGGNGGYGCGGGGGGLAYKNDIPVTLVKVIQLWLVLEALVELMMMVVSGQFLQIPLLEENLIFQLLQQSWDLEVLLVRTAQVSGGTNTAGDGGGSGGVAKDQEEDTIGEVEVLEVTLEMEEELGQVVVDMLVLLELPIMVMMVLAVWWRW